MILVIRLVPIDPGLGYVVEWTHNLEENFRRIVLNGRNDNENGTL